MDKPKFLQDLRSVAQPGEWVSCMTVARRLHPEAHGRALMAASKDASRRLSNLERFGHISRRPNDSRSGYEYRWEPEGMASRVPDLCSWLQPVARSVACQAKPRA